MALAQGDRRGEVRHWGTLPNRAISASLPTSSGAMGVSFISAMRPDRAATACTGKLTDLGHDYMVIATSRVQVKAGDRVTTYRCDALMLAKLHRAGELTAVWGPDTAHEAMRDLVRAWATSVPVAGKVLQHLQGFLRRHGRIFPGKKDWTKAYRRWLTTVRFEHPAQQIVLQDYIHAVADAEARIERLTRQNAVPLPSWRLAPVFEAIQAMRGGAFIVAVTVVAEVGDFNRFDNPRQLMAYLGLTPSEHSSGASVRRGGITKAGSSLARRALVEGAPIRSGSYRMQAPQCFREVVSRKLLDRIEGLPPAVRDIAWKGQLRMCQRYRHLMAAGRPKVMASTAIAREMAGFIWAIARTVTPAST